MDKRRVTNSFVKEVYFFKIEERIVEVKHLEGEACNLLNFKSKAQQNLQ